VDVVGVDEGVFDSEGWMAGSVVGEKGPVFVVGSSNKQVSIAGGVAVGQNVVDIEFARRVGERKNYQGSWLAVDDLLAGVESLVAMAVVDQSVGPVTAGKAVLSMDAPRTVINSESGKGIWSRRGLRNEKKQKYRDHALDCRVRVQQ